MHQQAKPVSQYVLDNFPDSDQCLWAQRDVVLSDLALGNTEAAATGIQQLESRFAKQSGAIWAISEVAEACSKLGRHEQARDLFRFNLYNCPNPDDTIWSLRGFVAESIALRDEASIDAGIKKLLSEYSTSKNLPMAAAHVADSLCRAGHRDASQLFQYVIDNYPDHEQALLAEVGLGHVRLWQDDIQGAEAIYQKVLSDHARHPELAEAVCLMGQGYYEQAELARQQGLSDKAVLNYQAALAKFGLITGASHEIPYDAPFAYHFSGECYHRLGQPDKAVDCYQKVCGSWPDYAYAWHLQFTMAKLYKELIRSGEVTEQEANPKMNAALATVVQKYPGCPASKAANDWLQVAARTREGEQR
jgi:tetratricopeptide (TPR) repeat protein